MLLVAALQSGCDTSPGVRDLGDSPPRVTSLEFSPRVVDIALADPSDLADGELDVALSISVDVEDAAGGAVDSVHYVIRRPLRTSVPLATGTLANAGGSSFSANRTVTLPVGQPGNYTIVVYASDALGQLSNQVQGNLLLDATNAPGNPPAIERVDASPVQIRPPGTLVIVATVSDPEGLPNILRVEITVDGGDTFNMVDDGESLGDDAAGDGKWSAAFQVPAGVQPGVQRFFLQAFDRNGNESEVAEISVTVL